MQVQLDQDSLEDSKIYNKQIEKMSEDNLLAQIGLNFSKENIQKRKEEKMKKQDLIELKQLKKPFKFEYREKNYFYDPVKFQEILKRRNKKQNKDKKFILLEQQSQDEIKIDFNFEENDNSNYLQIQQQNLFSKQDLGEKKNIYKTDEKVKISRALNSTQSQIRFPLIKENSFTPKSLKLIFYNKNKSFEDDLEHNLSIDFSQSNQKKLNSNQMQSQSQKSILLQRDFLDRSKDYSKDYSKEYSKEYSRDFSRDYSKNNSRQYQKQGEFEFGQNGFLSQLNLKQIQNQKSQKLLQSQNNQKLFRYLNYNKKMQSRLNEQEQELQKSIKYSNIHINYMEKKRSHGHFNTNNTYQVNEENQQNNLIDGQKRFFSKMALEQNQIKQNQEKKNNYLEKVKGLQSKREQITDNQSPNKKNQFGKNFIRNQRAKFLKEGFLQQDMDDLEFETLQRQIQVLIIEYKRLLSLGNNIKHDYTKIVSLTNSKPYIRKLFLDEERQRFKQEINEIEFIISLNRLKNLQKGQHNPNEMDINPIKDIKYITTVFQDYNNSKQTNKLETLTSNIIREKQNLIKYSDKLKEVPSVGKLLFEKNNQLKTYKEIDHLEHKYGKLNFIQEKTKEEDKIIDFYLEEVRRQNNLNQNFNQQN